MERSQRTFAERMAFLAVIALPVALLATLWVFGVQRVDARLDEYLTLVFVRDPSLSHMLSALKDEINTFPPLYFLLARWWSSVFGSTLESLRALSLFGALASFAVASFLLSRIFSCYAAVVSCLFLFISSGWLVDQMLNGRPYTLYMAAYLLASSPFFGTADSNLSWGRRALVIGSSGILVSLHYIGALLSGSLFLGSIVLLFIDRSPRWRQYALCLAVSWLALIPSVPFLLSQWVLGTEKIWLDVPSPLLGLHSMWFGINRTAVAPLLIIAMALGFLVRVYGQRAPGGPTTRQLSSPVLVYFLINSVFPLVLWIESQFGFKLFLNRFFLPCSIVWALGLALALDAAGSSALRIGSRMIRPGWIAVGAVALMTALPMGQYLQQWSRSEAKSSTVLPDIASKNREVPIVTGKLTSFLDAQLRGRQPSRYFLLMDEAQGLASTRAHAKGLKRHYYDSQILELEEVLANYPLLILFKEELNAWNERVPLETLESEDPFLLVRPTGAASPGERGRSPLARPAAPG